jgi:hypothetical protein
MSELESELASLHEHLASEVAARIEKPKPAP